MKKYIRSTIFAVAAITFGVIFIVISWTPGSTHAQQAPQGVERKILMRNDLSMPGWESVMMGCS